MLVEAPVQQVWESILPGILSVREDLPWQDWRPEDIYAACMSGEAHVLIRDDADPKDSFLIAKMVTDSASGRRSLFLWIAWSEDVDSAGKVIGGLDDIAYRSGCSSIQFSTGSQKLVEYAKGFGFDKVMYEVRKDIQLDPRPL